MVTTLLGMVVYVRNPKLRRWKQEYQEFKPGLDYETTFQTNKMKNEVEIRELCFQYKENPL